MARRLRHFWYLGMAFNEMQLADACDAAVQDGCTILQIFPGLAQVRTSLLTGHGPQQIPVFRIFCHCPEPDFDRIAKLMDERSTALMAAAKASETGAGKGVVN